MTRFDVGFYAVCSIVGIPPTVALAIDEPSGMLLTAGVVGVLFWFVPGRRA